MSNIKLLKAICLATTLISASVSASKILPPISRARHTSRINSIFSIKPVLPSIGSQKKPIRTIQDEISDSCDMRLDIEDLSDDENIFCCQDISSDEYAFDDDEAFIVRKDPPGWQKNK